MSKPKTTKTKPTSDGDDAQYMSGAVDSATVIPESVPEVVDKDLVPFTPAERVETLIEDLNARADFNTMAVQNAVAELRNTLTSLRALT